MKKVFALFLLTCCIMLTSCTNQTETNQIETKDTKEAMETPKLDEQEITVEATVEDGEMTDAETKEIEVEAAVEEKATAE